MRITSSILRQTYPSVSDRYQLYEGLFSEQDITTQRYDVFISHSYYDKEDAARLGQLFEDEGYIPFIDWQKTDLQDRSKMDADRAKVLRQVLKNCRFLVFIATSNSEESVWCPWELGIVDASTNGKCFIMPPLDDYLDSDDYKENEYLGIYKELSFDSKFGFLVGTIPLEDIISPSNPKDLVQKMFNRIQFM